jgi:hypothetical protein
MFHVRLYCLANNFVRFYCATNTPPPPPPFWLAQTIQSPPPNPLPPPDLPPGKTTSAVCTDASMVFLDGCNSATAFLQSCGIYILNASTTCAGLPTYTRGIYSIFYLNGYFFLGTASCARATYFVESKAPANASAIPQTAADAGIFQYDNGVANVTTGLYVSCITTAMPPQPPPLPPPTESPPPLPPPPPASPLSAYTLKFLMIFTSYNYAQDYLPNPSAFELSIKNGLAYVGTTNSSILGVFSGSVLVNTITFYSNTTCDINGLGACARLLTGLIFDPASFFPNMHVNNVTRTNDLGDVHVFFPPASPPPPLAVDSQPSGTPVDRLNNSLKIAVITLSSGTLCLGCISCYVFYRRRPKRAQGLNVFKHEPSQEQGWKVRRIQVSI